MDMTGTVQSVDRALHLLQLLAARSTGARLSDLAREAALPQSTTHRLLTALERRGFVQFEASAMRWHVGGNAFLVGMAFSRWQNFVAAAAPFLRRLRDITRETVNLGVLEDGDVITVAQVESREIKRAISPLGGRVPVLNSGMGKAILATWPDEAIVQLVKHRRLHRFTANSLRSLEDASQEISRIRQCGYACDNEEFVSGTRCVAAVILSTSGEAIGAVSVSAQADRLSLLAVPSLGKKVVNVAAEISSMLNSEATPNLAKERPL
ncbi:MAG: IclR family transcriptional regulator [Aliihoeflea sp.]